MSHKARLAPSADSLMLVASPIPLEAPVTTITLSWKGSGMMESSYDVLGEKGKAVIQLSNLIW